LDGHQFTLLVLRVAEGTTQIAAAEAHEDGGRTAVVALALQGMEYFVDFVHQLWIKLYLPFYVIASEAWQSRHATFLWIASSFLLAMTPSA
jgi:hypothetical protein